MTTHLVSLPHMPVTPESATCAYTQKVVKFARMFPDTVVYAPEGCSAKNHVQTLSDYERQKLFGHVDIHRTPFWPDDEGWALHNARAIAAINQRAQPGDLVMISGGWSQRQIRDAFAKRFVVAEPFVGYPGIVADYCAYESYAWRHHVYAEKQIDGRWYDTVIPNFFDPDEFVANDKPGDYLLFLGRVTQRKGPHVAAELAGRVGMKLLVAGPCARKGDGVLHGDAIDIPGDHVEYLGAVTIPERAELIANAYALLAPTIYVEPFGGVAVEAMMAGCPAITTDWGAFTETVHPDYRFATLREGERAVARAGACDRAELRAETRGGYSLDGVRPMFDRWFDRLTTMYEKGWHS